MSETTATVTPAAAPAPAAPILKKDPTPVFSIPVTKDNKEFITKQSERTGITQKQLLFLAITAAHELILGMPDYVEPAPVVKVVAPKKEKAPAKAKKAKTGKAAREEEKMVIEPGVTTPEAVPA
jgi:hypothetical protein